MGRFQEYLQIAWEHQGTVIQSELNMTFERWQHKALVNTILLYNQQAKRCILLVGERCTIDAIDTLAIRNPEDIKELSAILGRWV